MEFEELERWTKLAPPEWVAQVAVSSAEAKAFWLERLAQPAEAHDLYPWLHLPLSRTTLSEVAALVQAELMVLTLVFPVSLGERP